MRPVCLVTRRTALGMMAAFALVAPASLAGAQARTSDSELDALFRQLRLATDADTAKILEKRIWRIWLIPDDAALARRMAQVVAARQRMSLSIALGILNGVVHDYPDYAEGWNQRATVFYLLHDFRHALADIDKALQFEPRHFGALSGRALIHLQQHQRAAALKDMRAALALHPFLPEKSLFPELLGDIVHI